MPPSTCPLCSRIYCDHTHTARGQTYAEMMGDTRDVQQQPLNSWERRQEHGRRIQRRASDLLETQAVDHVKFGPLGSDDVFLYTEEGSEIRFRGHPTNIERLAREPLAYTRAEDQELVLWTKGTREEIRGSVHSIACQEALPEKWEPR